jgi:hypothetical protein
VSDLTEFLLARIAADEAALTIAEYGEDGYALEPWPFTEARVLAECEAKRRIVEDIIANEYDLYPSTTDGLSSRVLHLLARPYADHQDFRAEWRVSP